MIIPFTIRRFFFAVLAEHPDGEISISIDQDLPAVLMHEKHREISPELTDNPVVADLHEGDAIPGAWLLSSGVYLMLRDASGATDMVLLRRSDDARFAPGHLTEPAGRCSFHPLDTALAELNEEIDIRLDGGPRLAMSYQEKTGIPVTADQPIHALHLCDQLCPMMHSIELVSSKGIETFDAITVIDREHRTIEIRLPLVLDIVHCKVQVADGEVFNRQVQLISNGRRQTDPMVPSLNAFFDELLPEMEQEASAVQTTFSDALHAFRQIREQRVGAAKMQEPDLSFNI